MFGGNAFVKTIANMAYMTRPGDEPHLVEYAPGYNAVTPSGRPLDATCIRQPDYTRLALHHYMTKSWEVRQSWCCLIHPCAGASMRWCMHALVIKIALKMSCLHLHSHPGLCPEDGSPWRNGHETRHSALGMGAGKQHTGMHCCSGHCATVARGRQPNEATSAGQG